MGQLLLFLLLPAFALGQQCNIPGDCAGNSLDIDILGSERECLELCNSVEGCEWYSYDSSDGFCNALRDCDEVNPDCSTCVHGENECELPLMCFVDGECHGTYITHVDVATVEECLAQCYNVNPNCKYFSFFTDDKLCNFFETCSLDDMQIGVVSGERDCYKSELKTATKILLQQARDALWIHTPSHHGLGNATQCDQIPDYPLSTEGASAEKHVADYSQVINGSITICGGSYYACFSLDSALNIWVEFASLDVIRQYSASVVTPDGWWITGSYPFESQNSSSLPSGSEWIAGPDLPIKNAYHCVAKLNHTHFVMSGGYPSSSYLDDAYMFDWTSKTWTQLPNMPTAKDLHACVLYQDETMGQVLLVAGGNSDVSQGLNVEALSLATLEWTVLPKLPREVSWAKFIYDGADLILVNTYFGNLLRFNPENQMFSVIEGQTFPPYYDYGVSIVAITDKQLSGCT